MMSTPAAQPAQAPAAPVAAAAPAVETKKIDNKNPHEVYAALEHLIDEMIATVGSFSDRFFGKGSTYAKALGLPENAPKKQAFKEVQSTLRALKKDATKLYKVRTRGQKREGEVEAPDANKKLGTSRLVMCSPGLTELMGLGNWGLTSKLDKTRGNATHGVVTRFLASYAKLNMLQNPNEPSYFVADAALMKLFGAETFARKKVDPQKIRFIDFQKLLSADKNDRANFPGHLTSLRKDNNGDGNAIVIGEELAADIRARCADDAEGELGGATKKIQGLRTTLKTISDSYVKHVAYAEAAKLLRPGQQLTKLWEDQVASDKETYAKKAAEIRKAAEAFNFTVAANYPPPLVIPPVREKKPRATKATKRAPAKAAKAAPVKATPAK